MKFYVVRIQGWIFVQKFLQLSICSWRSIFYVVADAIGLETKGSRIIFQHSNNNITYKKKS